MKIKKMKQKEFDKGFIDLYVKTIDEMNSIMDALIQGYYKSNSAFIARMQESKYQLEESKKEFLK